jgi:phosphatidylglycerophosphatase C
VSEAADKPVVAAFDFDGTITRRDTLLPFLLHALGAADLARHGLLLSSTLLGYGLGLIDNGVAKERVLRRYLGGMGMEDLQQRAERFVMLALPALLRPEALRRIEWHKQQGHRCIVISASLELYVRPWALGAGFEQVIATQLDVPQDGLVSGKLRGKNCYGPEKVSRLEALLGARDCYTLYAYGDSRGDRELLSVADYAYYRTMPG